MKEMDFDREANELQHVFSQIDRQMASARRPQGVIEFFIIKVEDLRIKMYQEKGHQRPHVHIDYGKEKHAASYAIDSGERLEGSLPRRYDKAVATWIHKHRSNLNVLWAHAQKGTAIEEVLVAIQKGN
ncbi:DUF4160 domain-containing protein [Luteolibacter soli]|uniref:DUF4160 domain-containing protein n=1 Tax=Luteolibacter soli TaxID=3135280 RepID=A0ABU9B3L7_9BACT